MADGYDPCECVWSHEMAMRRLLSILRQSQSHCTDTECFNELPGSNPGDSVGSDPMFFAMIWAVLAMALFFLRPSSLRGDSEGKPSNRNQGGGGGGGGGGSSGGGPPAPPTAT